MIANWFADSIYHLRQTKDIAQIPLSIPNPHQKSWYPMVKYSRNGPAWIGF
jgi:hypothetical protein